MPEDSLQVRLYRGQDYAKLKSKCYSEGQLFVDPEFPANKESLGFDKDVEWKRPTELVEDPKFLLDANRFSVVQGELGDCWFMSALSAITLNPGLLCRVVPKDQDFSRSYAGIFHFRFWQSGEWVDVVVDDQLPVVYEHQLCFSHSSNPNEFWSALLEKAYAKLHGSYENIEAGKCYEATEDLTGGVTERFQLQSEEPPSHLFAYIVQATKMASLITCNVPGKNEEEGDTGLVSGHGYCLTGAKRLKVKVPWKPHVDLVRLRNPWGDDVEWRGAWSDKSDEWNLVPKEEKEKLKLAVDNDGEFWMTFVDFKKNFAEITITSLNPHTLNKEAVDIMDDLSQVVNQILLHPEHLKSPTEKKKKKVWEVVTYDGSWVRNSTAGGAPNNFQLFSNNNQYSLCVSEVDDDPQNPGTCTVVLTLNQKNRRIKNLPLLPVAIVIYKVGDDADVPCPLTAEWLRFKAPFLLKKFVKTRTVTHRLHLEPGKYILVPCTSRPDMEGEYLLRVFCEKAVSMEENDEEAKIIEKQVDDNKTPKTPRTPRTPKDVLDGKTFTFDNDNLSLNGGNLKQLFLASAGDEGKINAGKLQNMLSEVFIGKEFSIDLSRSLLALMDRDLSGSVDYYELETLVDSLRKWMIVYESRKDKDTRMLSGRTWGLGDALSDLGYQLPRRIQSLVVVRYGNDEGNISLCDFLMVASRFSVMLERFNGRLENGTPKASLNLAEWMQDTLYC